MRQVNFITGASALVLVLLTGCTATRLTTQAQLPPPLIEQLPVRVGIYYSKEFREYVHRETRSNIEYEIGLGPAHVTNIDWLMKAMFAELVPVDDPTRVSEIQPPLVFVLEPKFEEYSFLTPKDVAGEAFIVTIRYLLTLYDGSGSRVDSFTLTGYGREKAGSFTSKEPLQVATQRAMRDAGAKVAVELTDQEAVRLLLRNAGSFPTNAPPETIPPAGAPPPRAAPTVEKTPVGEPDAAAPPEKEPPPSGSGRARNIRGPARF
jgi:hypothetical protein